MGKIVYNKEKPGRRLTGGGPRDIQMRQRLMQEELLRNASPTPHIITQDKSKPSSPVVDMSQYLPLTEVKKKIEDAVKSTEEAARVKYESGIKNLNDELSKARSNINKLKEEIQEKNSKISELNSKISSTPDISNTAQKKINERDLKIVKLESGIKDQKSLLERSNRDVSDLTSKIENASRLLQEKDSDIKELQKSMSKRDDYLHSKDIEIHNKNKELKSKEEELHKKDLELLELKSKSVAKEDISSELSEKLDKLYAKIADGSIRSLVGSGMDRPDLEDRIFIDPLDDAAGFDLDPHIDIKEEKDEEAQQRDVSNDVDKLRTLLKMKRR